MEIGLSEGGAVPSLTDEARVGGGGAVQVIFRGLREEQVTLFAGQGVTISQTSLLPCWSIGKCCLGNLKTLCRG